MLNLVLTFTSTLASPVVPIVEGKPEESQNFQIHRDLLYHDSKFSRAALTGDFEEAQTGLITFDDISVGTLQAFTGWLYFGRLKITRMFPLPDPEPKMTTPQHVTTRVSPWMRLYRRPGQHSSSPERRA